MQKSIRMYRVHRVTAKTIAKYPKNTVWVDVWHLAFPQPDGIFVLAIKQSSKNFGVYWDDIHTKTIGHLREIYSFEALLSDCVELITVLGLKATDFNFHGSTLGDTAFLRKAITEKLGGSA